MAVRRQGLRQVVQHEALLQFECCKGLIRNYLAVLGLRT